ncbi:MAG TPA: hypothetical protein VGJ41_14050 [Nocardioides sp.]|jgi:hypothetical protein
MTTKRLSVIIGDADQARLDPFFVEDSPERSALQAWLTERGEKPATSDASSIRALLQAGAAAIREELLDDGYAELAEIYDEKAARAERRTARDRYADRTEAIQ